MAIQFAERPKSRSSTRTSITTEWVATGEENEAAVRAYSEAATPQIYPTQHGTLYRQDVSLTHEGFQLYYVSVPYGPREVATGQYSLSFDTTGGTIHVTTSKETMNSYGTSPPDYKNVIGVNGDQVDGTDIIIPALKITASFTHPARDITIAYIKSLAYYTGMVNSGTFLTFAPGEVLFLGASGSEGSDTESTVAYQFAMSQNITGLSIGDIAGVAKRGWDYAWVKYKDAVDSSKPVKQPEFVYVERLYEEVDLVSALGFG